MRLPGGPNARYALLFRDFLRADPIARDAWGRFKIRLAQTAREIGDYGQIKQPATDVLMRGRRGLGPCDRVGTPLTTGWSPLPTPSGTRWAVVSQLPAGTPV